MRTALMLSTAAFTLLAATACGPASDTPDAADYAAALPDERILVNMPVSTERSVGDMAESYLTTAQVTTDINSFIGDVLDDVGHITDFDPTWSEDDQRFLWGPWSDGGLDPNETVLYVELDEATGTYGWAVAQRPKTSTSDDDWVAMIAGESTPGATDDEGSGILVIDFDAISSLNPAETGTGAFYAEYDVRADGADVAAGFEEFAEDAGLPDRANAGYIYGQDLAGNGYMDLGYLADVQEDGSAEETVVLRTRWQADGQGRGDVVIFDGDIAPLAYSGSECWGADYTVVFEQNNAEMHMDGDESLCAFDEPEWNEDAPEA